MSREGTFYCHAAPTDCKQEAELYFRNYIVYIIGSKHTGYLEFIFGNFNFISEMAMLKVSIKAKLLYLLCEGFRSMFAMLKFATAA